MALLIEMTLLIGTLIHTLSKSFKKSAGLRKTCFLSKKTIHLFFKKKNSFFGFFKYILIFVLFLRETQKPHSELFLLHHAISPFSELHNNSLLCLLLHSKLRAKKCTHLCFHKVLLVSSLKSGKQRKAPPTQSL